jgi:hypothetical protein
MCASAWIGLGLSLVGVLMPTVLFGIHPFLGGGLGAVIWFIITFPHLITAGLALASRRDSQSSTNVMLIAEVVLLAGWTGWMLAAWLDNFWGFFWVPILQLLLVMLGPVLKGPLRGP